MFPRRYRPRGGSRALSLRVRSDPRRGHSRRSGGQQRSLPPREEVVLNPALVLLGSLLAVAVWEFCRPRRQREFPALRRRLGNLGIWLLNIVLAAFTFAPPGIFRPQLETVLGVAL